MHRNPLEMNTMFISVFCFQSFKLICVSSFVFFFSSVLKKKERKRGKLGSHSTAPEVVSKLFHPY